MPDIWVISDTHFGHENSLKWGRPFSSVDDMDSTMVDNWNSVVKPGDKVYHLGDVFFGCKDRFKKNWVKLHGKKRLIVGNHDDIKFLSSGTFFQKVYLWRVWRDKNLLFTHVPVHESSLMERVPGDGCINVHGHIHTRPAPQGPYKCVCVEQTNYTPVHIEELTKSAT